MRIDASNIYAQINLENLKDSRQRADLIREQHDKALESAINFAARQAEISHSGFDSSSSNGNDSGSQKSSDHQNRINQDKMQEIRDGKVIEKSANYQKGDIIDIMV